MRSAFAFQRKKASKDTLSPKPSALHTVANSPNKVRGAPRGACVDHNGSRSASFTDENVHLLHGRFTVETAAFKRSDAARVSEGEEGFCGSDTPLEWRWSPLRT